MIGTIRRACVLIGLAHIFSGVAATADQGEAENQNDLVELGRSLFFDTNFSAARNISCATCHDPAHGFVDSRNIQSLAPASLGSDGSSLGTRNAPPIAYLGAVPEFGIDDEEQYVGGFFHDGRAQSLAVQATMPVLDPKEMALANEAELMERLHENQQYIVAFQNLFGDDSINSEQGVVEGFGAALAAFESSDYFSPFDSKYDRYLMGQYSPTAQEQVGMALFFTPGFTSCNECHQVQTLPNALAESFSNNRYENIGVPVNPSLALAWVDEGLANIPALASLSPAERDSHKGKFKVPTLRNVALTAPYMHNGVFKDLRTVLKFYNKYNAVTQESQTNPETKKPWAAPEVEGTIAHDKLPSLFLTDKQIDALMSFLLMLTDQRYEHLLR